MEQVKAIQKSTRLSAQKARLVADQIRGKSVSDALLLLEYSPKKGAAIMRKVLKSAAANAEDRYGLDIDELKVVLVQVNEGPTLKRFRARAKGRGTRILKRTSHIEVHVQEVE